MKGREGERVYDREIRDIKEIIEVKSIGHGISSLI